MIAPLLLFVGVWFLTIAALWPLIRRAIRGL